ncbi:hypothetical protein [Chenggangzhangella methanolivorans]|uniref:Uncharacterized protein n=1 Tax=Chenggangzhangella methanolivorans TaxID=1437009 RepID=A0A9E6RHY7_9HYPH|nr:hypothetical protein [Chenggangzhangella methanolivorans]QZO01776.1 hypothetical protein K6K41_10660 [Chenggangzhangella methanolivorans]
MPDDRPAQFERTVFYGTNPRATQMFRDEIVRRLDAGEIGLTDDQHLHVLTALSDIPSASGRHWFENKRTVEAIVAIHANWFFGNNVMEYAPIYATTFAVLRQKGYVNRVIRSLESVGFDFVAVKKLAGELPGKSGYRRVGIAHTTDIEPDLCNPSSKREINRLKRREGIRRARNRKLGPIVLEIIKRESQDVVDISKLEPYLEDSSLKKSL